LRRGGRDRGVEHLAAHRGDRGPHVRADGRQFGALRVGQERVVVSRVAGTRGLPAAPGQVAEDLAGAGEDEVQMRAVARLGGVGASGTERADRDHVLAQLPACGRATQVTAKRLPLTPRPSSAWAGGCPATYL